MCRCWQIYIMISQDATKICIIKPYLAAAPDTCCWSSIRDLTPSIRWGPCGWTDSWKQCHHAGQWRGTDRPGEGPGRMIERNRKRLLQLRTEAVTYWSSRRFEAKKGMESDVTLQKPSLQLKTCTIDFVIANSYHSTTVWYLPGTRGKKCL